MFVAQQRSLISAMRTFFVRRVSMRARCAILQSLPSYALLVRRTLQAGHLL
jgi:hypothetical protein